ncbi:uncharacterized protein KGF55_005380 [Candida pseudojiufengensis]|uniref:uncharacterized protein n=1 Tax=Candida pseudojiufengensis TaxID=497109 RepID=UPI0022258D9B|nr:uncharacterized protein KGF55_005380 [Candida pseudojiufengensis]KAI5959403.1 hypothetical protein KGF55_005380 [Candida pseudojiufengensis]
MLFISILSLYIFSLTQAADNWATYPQIPKTASINGFADPIIDVLPDCAKDCVKFSTSNTPCPYWDTGCFCVMPQWSGLVGQCIAQNCQGEDVQSARYIATSLCSTVGANTWMMPASISTMLETAAGNAREVTTLTDKTAMQWVIGSGSSDTNLASSTDSASSNSNSGSGSAAATSTENSSSASNTGSSSTSATTNTSSTSNLAILQTGSVGTVILGFLVSLFF